MKNLIFIFFVALFISCEKTDLLETLTGNWVEEVHQEDTIFFDIQNQDWLILTRDTINYGPYLYEIYKDSIVLRSLLSSIYHNDKKYFFRLDEKNNSFEIGNFYDSDRAEGYNIYF